MYVVSEALDNFASQILPQVDPSTKFVLITGDSDLTIRNVSEVVSDARIAHMFSQNCVADHPKITRIPIGMDFHTLENTVSKPSQNDHLAHIARQAHPLADRIPLIYVNTSASHPERERAKRMISYHLCYIESTRLEKVDCFEPMARYQFVLSPRGCGLDCHRAWEAMALGCIPIMKTSGIDPLFEGMDVILVNDWDEVTQELLTNFVKWYTAQEPALTHFIQWHLVQMLCIHAFQHNHADEEVVKRDKVYKHR